jgi:hypothetical protein
MRAYHNPFPGRGRLGKRSYPPGSAVSEVGPAACGPPSRPFRTGGLGPVPIRRLGRLGRSCIERFVSLALDPRGGNTTNPVRDFRVPPPRVEAGC